MDSYQAIYDAVRSKISNGDIGRAVTDVAYQQFDISNTMAVLQQEFSAAAYEMQRPSAIFKPVLSVDGNQYCFLLGEDLMSGIAGFGSTVSEAATAFDVAFYEERAPGSQLKAEIMEKFDNTIDAIKASAEDGDR